MIRDHSKTQTQNQNNNLQYGASTGMPQVSVAPDRRGLCRRRD